MGTRLQLEVEGLPEAALVEAAEAAVRECERIEAACSTWRPDSAWSRLNAAGGAELALGSEWVSLLETVLAWTQRTQGAFDPVLGALLRTWDTRHGGRLPSAAELRVAREASGARLLVLDAQRGTARLTHPGAALEEGGFIKGYALDRMAAVLRRAGVQAGLLDFGGQLLAFGAPRRASIADAAERHRPTFELELAEGSLSTSGTSEHGRHIVDPRSGERSPAWGSVSVVAADGLTADILSTALYVLGPERGLAWAEANQVAALFQRAGQAPRQTRALRVRTAHLSAARSRP
jgi:thiamine biosynthesis lipoprotein